MVVSRTVKKTLDNAASETFTKIIIKASSLTFKDEIKVWIDENIEEPFDWVDYELWDMVETPSGGKIMFRTHIHDFELFFENPEEALLTKIRWS